MFDKSIRHEKKKIFIHLDFDQFALSHISVDCAEYVLGKKHFKKKEEAHTIK